MDAEAQHCCYCKAYSVYRLHLDGRRRAPGLAAPVTAAAVGQLLFEGYCGTPTDLATQR
jgi:hypothetical protein